MKYRVKIKNPVIGVPITWLDKFNPDQFEIIGFFNNYKPETAGDGFIYGTPTKVSSTKSLFRGPALNGEALYFRVLIRWKTEAMPTIDKDGVILYG